MQKKARSIIDTILGEAVYGSSQARYADMLGIASVISNRATLGNVTPEDVVAAPGQFSAYGKSLPKGVEEQRPLAEQAWKQVSTIGPVTPATYYSTPAAAKNLPDGLEQVDETTGHVYQIDPQNRAFATAKGYVKPAVDLVASVAQKANQTARGLATGAINAVGAILPDTGPTIEARPDMMGGVGLEERPAINPLTAGRASLGFARQNESAINPELRDAALGLASEFGETLGINSGYRNPGKNASVGGATRSQHLTGNAIDIDVRDWDDAKRQKAVLELAQRGVNRFGMYSGNTGMHVDLGTTGMVGGKPHFMFDKSAANMSRAPDWFREVADALQNDNLASIMPDEMAAPQFSSNPGTIASEYAKAAQSMRDAGVRGVGGYVPDQTYGAPTGVVERGGALAPARENPANRNAFDTMRAGMDNPVYGPGQTVPASRPTQRASYAALEAKPSAPSAPNVASAYADMGRSMQAAGVSPSPQTQPTGPTTADLASAYGQMGADLAGQGIANLSGAALAAPQKPSLEQVAQVSYQAPALSPPTEVKEYKIAPPQEVPTVQAPAATPTVATPQATTVAAPTAPATPKSKVQQRVVGALVGGLLGGLPGAAIGGLMGPTVANGFGKMGGLGGMFGGPPDVQRSNYGSGLAAMSDILGGGGYTGATAYSRSTPGYSVTNLGNGWVEKTNQYGVKSYDFTGYTDSLFGGRGGFPSAPSGGTTRNGRGDRSLSKEVSDAIDRGSAGLY